jgi:hypothetical protein
MIALNKRLLITIIVWKSEDKIKNIIWGQHTDLLFIIYRKP